MAQTSPQDLPPNDPGRISFERRCGRRHEGDDKGGKMGPDSTTRLANFRGDDRLVSLIHSGLPASGMPPNPEGEELAGLIRFLRSVEARPAGSGRGGFGRQQRVTAQMVTGARLEGMQPRRLEDLPARTDDGKEYIAVVAAATSLR